MILCFKIHKTFRNPTPTCVYISLPDDYHGCVGCERTHVMLCIRIHMTFWYSIRTCVCCMSSCVTHSCETWLFLCDLTRLRMHRDILAHVDTVSRYAAVKRFICTVRILQHTATHCNTLQHTATHCNAMSRQYIHTTSQKSRDVLAYAVPKYEYSNTLQHTATHCQTLLHTATQYITLHHNPVVKYLTYHFLDPRSCSTNFLRGCLPIKWHLSVLKFLKICFECFEVSTQGAGNLIGNRHTICNIL